MRRLILRLVLAAAATSLLAPAGAAGAVSTIGTGTLPGLSVDGAGTAYVAWLGTGDPQPLYFCRLPRGATACDPGAAKTISAPGASIRRPFIAIDGTNVSVIQARYGGDIPGFGALLRFRSTDGGATFGPAEVVGDAPIWEAVQGPGATLSGVTNAEGGGTQFQNVPLFGPAPVEPDGTTQAGKAVLSLDHPYDASVGLDGASPLAVFSTGSGETSFSRYVGSGDLNDGANWTTAQPIGQTAYPKLAGGPAGLFLLSSDPVSGVYVRRFDGTTFAAPVTLGITGSSPTHHLFQDAAGRLHAVFNHTDAAGQHVTYASSDGGAAWARETLVHYPDPASGAVGNMRVATAPDHVGWTAFTAGDDVRVATLGPVAKAPPTITTTTAVAKPSGGVYKVTLGATIGLPPGVTPAQGCSGSVKVVIKRGRKRLKSVTVKVKPNCRYVVKVKLKKRKVKKAKRLRAAQLFSGNAYVAKRVLSTNIRVKR